MTETKFDKQLYLAIIAEKCQLYDDMYSNIEYIITNNEALPNQDQSNLISNAFKHKLSLLRDSIYKLSSIEFNTKKDSSSPSEYIQYITEYKNTIINKLITFCNNVIQLIDKYILPKTNTFDSQTIFYTMKGDYLRYIAEISLDESEQKTFTEQALSAYNVALEKSEKLEYTNVNKLNLMLNLTVFYYEILHNANKAHQIAIETLNNAKQLIKAVNEEDEKYRDSFTLVALLEDNIRMWDIEME